MARRISTVLALLVGTLASGTAAAETLLQHVETSVEGTTRTVKIQTDATPRYSVFRMTEPYRIFVELADAQLEGDALPPLTPGDGVLRSVSLQRHASAMRVVIELESPRDHRIVEKGRELWVHIDGAPPRPEAALGQVRLDGGRLVAQLEGDIAQDAVKVEAIPSPPRLIVDIQHARVEPKYQRVDVAQSGVERVRVADKSGSVRLVLDLESGQEAPSVRVAATDGQLALILTPAASARARAPKTDAYTSPAPVAAAASTPPSQDAPAPEAPVENVEVQDIRFEPMDGFMRVTVTLSKDAFRVASGGSEGAPRLLLPDATVPKRLERTLDVSEVSQGALAGVSSFNSEQGAVLAAGIFEDTEHRHWIKGRRLMWDFRTKAEAVAHGSETTASYRTDMAASLGSLTTGRARYTGRRISLDLKDADIQNVLRLLADVSRLNIVASDDVQGTVTIKLRNVPWDQALDIILRSKQLDKQRNGNIIRVAPIETLRREEDLRVKRKEAQIKLEPLTVRLIPVSYAVAGNIQTQIASLLSERGEVNVDERTNVLIVEDIAEVLEKVERLVKTLDTQTPQVLIESRIVEARNNFSRELGIQWGGTVAASQQFGNQTGLDFPSNIRVSGGADDNQNPVVEGVVANPQYAVNLPAAVGAGGGGALGLVLGSVDGSALINLRLSAAEAVGKIKLVSAPKIVTMDNTQARILSGERIPITVITANGPTTRFLDANLELGVTPHVTQDGSILMNIQAKKNELSDRVDFLGVPGILTNEATTQMIVKDGDTAVLGGLYRRNSAENESGVPFLSKIPVLGWLFKSTTRTDAREELLIFISPRIVNRQAALVSGG